MDIRISSKFIKVNDLNIHYLVAGEGEVILLLHGWPTSSYLWRYILPELSASNKVIAIDLPGFGQSDKRLEDSFSFRYYNRVLTGFLDNLGIEKITLGFHDLGGPIGLYWAVQNMERVKRMIFFNTLVYPNFSFAVKLFGLATVLPGIRHWISSPAGIKKAIYFGVYQKHKLTDEIIQKYQSPFHDKISRKVLLKTVQRLSRKGFQEIEQKLPLFTGPVQIIYGQKDKILPDVKETIDRVKNDLPQAKVNVITDGGHFLQEEVSKEICQALLEFITQSS